MNDKEQKLVDTLNKMLDTETRERVEDLLKAQEEM